MRYQLGDRVKYKPRNIECVVVEANDFGGTINKYVLEYENNNPDAENTTERIECRADEIEHMYSIKHR